MNVTCLYIWCWLSGISMINSSGSSTSQGSNNSIVLPSEYVAWEAGTHPLFTGEAIDKECYNITLNVRRKKWWAPNVNYHQCLRIQKDTVSEIIRKNKVWWECLSIWQLWRRMSFLKTGIAGGGKSEGLTYVDVGGNIGSCSLMMAAAGANVIAFEPHPSNLFYFSRSIQMNVDKGIFPKNRIKLYPYGVGDVAGYHTIFSEIGNMGNAMLNVPIKGAPTSILSRINHTIRVVRIDDVLWPDRNSQHPHISTLKIDVQGYEIKALKGMKALLEAKAVAGMFVEISPGFLSAQGGSGIELCNLLYHHNYTLYMEHYQTVGSPIPYEMCQGWDEDKTHLYDAYDVFAFLKT